MQIAQAFQRADQVVKDAIARGAFTSANVLVGQHEKVLFRRAYGRLGIEDDAPLANEHTRYDLASLTKPGGRLTVAHGMSRAALQAHHSGRASQVSIDLIHEQELAALMAPWFEVDVVVSTDRMYQVSGVRREVTAHSHGGHVHSHSHGDHDHHHGAGDTPMEELLALMKYMVGHNDAHAQELAELADQLRQAGRVGAHQKLMDAVADFDMANARLDAVFSELNREI